MLSYIIKIFPIAVQIIRTVQAEAGNLAGSEKRLIALSRIWDSLQDIPIINELTVKMRREIMSYLDIGFDWLVALAKDKVPKGTITIAWASQEVTK